MLKIEQNISGEYKSVIEQEETENQRLKNEYENKLQDEARLLDIKSDRIRKLEAQLNNYIYKRGMFFLLKRIFFDNALLLFIFS